MVFVENYLGCVLFTKLYFNQLMIIFTETLSSFHKIQIILIHIL